MKKCSYCGRECSDDLEVCPIDEMPLEGVGPLKDVSSNPKKAADQPLALPLRLQRHIFNEPIDWLTISKEGLTWHESLPPLSLKWNEIASLHLRGTQTRNVFFSRTNWDYIVLKVNGFELSPIVINVQGSNRRLKDVLNIITSTLTAFRTGRPVPPWAQVFPKLALAIEHLPVKIGFAKGHCFGFLMLGTMIFFCLFLLPIFCLNDAGARLMAALFLSPIGGISLGMIILNGFRLVRHAPILTLTENGLIYRRGWKDLSISWHQIIELQYQPLGKKVVVLNDQRTRPISLKLGGLEHTPPAIFYMTKHLHASYSTKANGVKGTTII
jgi:hypothetical protein